MRKRVGGGSVTVEFTQTHRRGITWTRARAHTHTIARSRTHINAAAAAAEVCGSVAPSHMAYLLTVGDGSHGRAPDSRADP